MTHPPTAWPTCATLALALCISTSALAQKVKLSTSAGDIVIELDADKAPKTVDKGSF